MDRSSQIVVDESRLKSFLRNWLCLFRPNKVSDPVSFLPNRRQTIMYGLPKDFDGTFLVGRLVEMVCFSQYQIYLNFDSEILITIESAISYQNDEIVTVPSQTSNLMELIGNTISEVRSDDQGTLILVFENQKTLKIYDTSKQYESYSITNKGKTIII